MTDSSAVRNLALIGHGSSGKTSLCESLLKHVGLTTRIPAGIMDFAPDEKERGHSIDLSVATFAWQDIQATVLDVPGYQEFFYNVVSALEVVESAVVVISATDGITVNTRKAWEIADRKGLPRAIVLTKLDGENIDLAGRLAEIEKHFGPRCIPFVMPDDVGRQLTKVHKVMEPGSPAAEYREKLVEKIVESDDELCESYLGGEKISDEALLRQMAKAIRTNALVPILCVVPTQGIGVGEFLDFVKEYMPSPSERAPRTARIPGKEEEKRFEPSPDAPFSAQVFKVFNDPFGRIVYFRVWSGTLPASSVVYDASRESSEKVAGIFRMLGKETKSIDKAVAGDIVAVTKVESLNVGDTLVANEKEAVLYEKPPYPTPMFSLAVFPKSRGDEQKISASLAKLAEEDPTFRVKRAEETNEVVVSGMSNLHIDLMMNRLKNRFKVECTQALPKIPYRETITSKSESRYRHKKQAGGHGQFAEVAIRIEPGEKGTELEFINQIVGGVVPGPFVVSTEKGIQGAMKRGILAGYPVVEVRVALYDGKTHDVDSSDAAFQVAASQAFQEAFRQAKPVFLEPVVNLVITVPSKNIGDISGHLNGRRGRIMGSDVVGDETTIKAQVPLAEVMMYSTDLKSMTGGEGNYTMEFSHYDIVPPNIQEKIIAQSKKEK